MPWGLLSNIAAQIIQQEGDYILSLKGNQGNLHKGVKKFFKKAEAKDWAGIEYTYSETTEAGHHRTERRQVWAAYKGRFFTLTALVGQGGQREQREQRGQNLVFSF